MQNIRRKSKSCGDTRSKEPRNGVRMNGYDYEIKRHVHQLHTNLHQPPETLWVKHSNLNAKKIIESSSHPYFANKHENRINEGMNGERNEQTVEPCPQKKKHMKKIRGKGIQGSQGKSSKEE